MGFSVLREQASGLTRDQRNAFFAAWLGWAMDAFDYFLLVFVISDVAKDFDRPASRSRPTASGARARPPRSACGHSQASRRDLDRVGMAVDEHEAPSQLAGHGAERP